MTPREAATKLIEAHYDQPAIVALLDEAGVKVTQPTVSRIASGEIKNPGFEIGSALIALCEQKLPPKPRKRKAA